MIERMRAVLVPVLGVILCLFTLAEVNYSHLQPQSRLAVFGLLGVVLCYLLYPLHRSVRKRPVFGVIDFVLAGATVVCFGYVIVQTEPLFESFWAGGQSLGNRAGNETTLDFWIGLIGLLLVLEATRRSIGLALPLLALAFIAHAYYGEVLPDWMLPHSQMKLASIVNVTFLQSLGVFGPATKVMFTYVFLFVVFGGFLEATGATQFIVDFAERLFGRSQGGPAKVAVLGSGLMGSLSGSAVANAVTTGTFTIPMMRNAGFKNHVAGGITAAAASGGALVPPVMGAGAYMMLELVDPPVTFLQVASAAVIPAVLYYFSIFMIVHFYSRRTGTAETSTSALPESEQSLFQLMFQFEGIVFFGALISLVTFLVMGYSPFRAVTYSLGVIIVLGLVHPRERLTWKVSRDALVKSAKNGVSLVSAGACVGIVIGIVQATSIVGDFNVIVRGVVEHSLFLALIGIMVCSIILGMGVPSVVCYLLMATLMGSLLKELGVIPLAAHLFIFYFGMMSMVTPPVALAAFASASLAQANVMRTAFSAFLFSLVGFTLPFMFVYRPELLLLSNKPEIVRLRVREVTADQRGRISGNLKRAGEGLKNAKLVLSPVDGFESDKSLTTDSTGRFQAEISAGNWRIEWLEPDEKRQELGLLRFNPTRAGPSETSTGNLKKPTDERLQFVDHRLSIPQVFMATVVAGLGILSLAAGIAGYLFAPLNIVMRILAFVTAGLLLFPDQGFPLGSVHVAVSDIVGAVLLVVIAVVNGRLISRSGTSPDTSPVDESGRE